MAEQGTLQLYHGEKQTAIKLIKDFWKAHNNEDQTDAEALKDLEAWTAEGHRFYFIRLAQEFVGFLHLGNRGENRTGLKMYLCCQPIKTGASAPLRFAKPSKKFVRTPNPFISRQPPETRGQSGCIESLALIA